MSRQVLSCISIIHRRIVGRRSIRGVLLASRIRREMATSTSSIPISSPTSPLRSSTPTAPVIALAVLGTCRMSLLLLPRWRRGRRRKRKALGAHCEKNSVGLQRLTSSTPFSNHLEELIKLRFQTRSASIVPFRGSRVTQFCRQNYTAIGGELIRFN